MARCAVYTLGRDERFHLPLWIRYYQQHFDYADMYVLDHDSQEPDVQCALDMFECFGGNVRHVTNDVIFDHEWLLQTVMSMQRELLGSYEYVLFTDTDEWVIPADGTLREFIEHMTQPAYRCMGYEVVEDHMFRSAFYDKTLLAKHPLSWVYGYHHASPEPNVSGDLFMYHLHRLDFAEAWDKNMRWQQYQFDPVAVASGFSVQNQLASLDEFKTWFYDTSGLLPFLGTGFGVPEPWHDRLRAALDTCGASGVVSGT